MSTNAAARRSGPRPGLSTEPRTDTAIRAPDWRVVFCRPEPSPDWPDGTLDISSEVSAENAIVLAAPVSSRPVAATA
jgi:hypothetical protein